MPTYCFECDKCGTSWDATFGMKAKKESPCIKCGKTGRRVFTVPTASIDTKINPHDLDALTKKTANIKGGTLGNLWDMAAEMSDKRGGVNDPIRKKALSDYEKQRKGKKYRGKLTDSGTTSIGLKGT